MSSIHAAVEQALAKALQRGEIGIQMCAYLDGELVVDAWGGVADWQSGKQVDGETLFTVFSATKAVAATALHIQAERGLVEYDRTIAEYWPAFGSRGKQSATVRHALDHSVGIPCMPPGCTAEQMCDWEWMSDAIAEMPPLWEPGARHGYHAYTFGWIIGELVRRVDPSHRGFGQWVQDEICRPLGIDSLWLGIPDEVEGRVGRLKNTAARADAPPLPADSLVLRAIPPDLGVTQEVFGRADVRRSCHPGAGGIMNARSLARMYAMLANHGELDGVRLLSRERVDEIRTLQSDDQDAVIGAVYRRGLGYWLGGQPLNANSAVFGANPGALGHPGAGGSIGWADPDTGLAVAIIKNRMLSPATADENPLVELADTVRASLGL